MRIAFCVAAGARLASTLARNLAALRGTAHVLAVCALGVGGEALRAFAAEPALCSFVADEPRRVPRGQALNAAHRLGLRAGPDVLFRLEGVVSAATVALVEEVFARGGDVVLHHWSRAWGDASMGRIAMSAASWSALGGYDEAAPGRTWLDFDLLVRARARGMRYEQSAAGLDVEPPPTTEELVAELPDEAVGDPAARLRELDLRGFVATMERAGAPSLEGQRRFAGRTGTGEEIVL